MSLQPLCSGVWQIEETLKCRCSLGVQVYGYLPNWSLIKDVSFICGSAHTKTPTPVEYRVRP